MRVGRTREIVGWNMADSSRPVEWAGPAKLQRVEVRAD